MIAKFDNLHIIMSSVFKYIFSSSIRTIPSTNHINGTIYTYTSTYHLHWLIVDLSAPHHSRSLPIFLQPHTTSHSSHVSVSRLCLTSLSHVSLPVLHLSQLYTSYIPNPSTIYTFYAIYHPILPNGGNKKTITQNLIIKCRGFTKY